MANTTKSSNYKKLEHFVFDKFFIGELSKDDLVQLIELCGELLELKTIQRYADENGLSYNGVKKHRNIKVILQHKFVLE
jgi:hypothetical protein